MSLFSRVSMLFHMRANAALDEAEDPQQVMSYAYQQQQELLRKVKLGLIDVATSKQQLERQARDLRARVPVLEDQAKRAIAAEREDLARISLERKQTAIHALTDLERQIADVAEDERKLAAAQARLAARTEQFRTHKDVMSARFSAAQAQVRVHEALSGVGGDLAELSMALGRAEEKTQRLISRASAIDALIESGALDLPSGGDRVEAELRKAAMARDIDAELATLKAQPAAAPKSKEGTA
jgi:phage shock protein A